MGEYLAQASQIKIYFTVNGKNIDDISDFGPNFNDNSESEVLFASGTKFKVTNYQEDVVNNEKIVYIVLEEI